MGDLRSSGCSYYCGAADFNKLSGDSPKKLNKDESEVLSV